MLSGASKERRGYASKVPGVSSPGKIKRFKRIALRCEKTATNYASFLALVCGFILIKSVHTA